MIYRPPKHNKFGEYIPNYDKLLILGDFNVHICCTADLLAKEFLNLLNAFDLVLHVNVPTHQHGHTLDLVLYHGFSLCNVEVCENVFSDHKSIMFSAPSAFYASKSITNAHRSRLFTSTTRNAFSLAFHDATLSMEDCHL